MLNEEDSQDSLKAQTEFLANISHEMRTPLNAIVGFVQLINQGTIKPDSPHYKELLGDIISSANTLLTFINNVLDLTKIEAGKMEFFPEKVDLVALLKEVERTFYAAIIEKQIQFSFYIDPILDNIIIDQEKLRRIFLNYISNAIKFTSHGGKIMVKIYPENKKNFRLEVSDTGIGIPKKALNKLFKKFQQLDTTSRKQHQGTGLGLALVKDIVEAQGGEVGVTSVPGSGSTFYAILPCFPYHHSITREIMNDETVLEVEPSILLIESKSHDRTVLASALRDAGYKLNIASDISIALQKYSRKKFDAIMLDLFSPRLGNCALIQSLRAQSNTSLFPPALIKILWEQPISLGLGIQHFLVKPISGQALLSAIESFKLGTEKCLLVIDGDQDANHLVEKTLRKKGFRVFQCQDKVKALLILEQEKPELVLFDPLTFGSDSLEFLHYFRQTQRGPFTHMIIWTHKNLNAEERMVLKSSIHRVLLIGECIDENILRSIEQRLPTL